MKNLVMALAALTFVGSAVSANAQMDLGASVGWYVPSSSEMRSAFGSSIFHLGFGSVGKATTNNLSVGTHIDFITANKNGNRLFIVPLTLEAEHALSTDRNATTKPYVKGFVGAAYMDYAVTRGGIRSEEKLIRSTYGAEFGVVVSDRLRLSARYNAFPKSSGFDFSGVTLSATFQILK